MPCRASRAAASGRSTGRGWESSFIRRYSGALMRRCGCRSYSVAELDRSPFEGDQRQPLYAEAADCKQTARMILSSERGGIAAQGRRGYVERIEVGAAELTAGRKVD